MIDLDNVFQTNDKCYLFSKFPIDPDLFQKLPLRLYPGISLDLTPQYALERCAGRDAIEKEHVALGAYVFPGHGLGLEICNVCIRIDRSVPTELQDRYFWFMAGALLLVKPLYIDIAGSFSYGNEEEGFIKDPCRWGHRTNISMDSFLSSEGWKNALQYNEGDIERAKLCFSRIVKIFEAKGVAPRPYFVLKAFFEAVIWERSLYASSIFSKLFPLIDSFSGNPSYKHVKKVPPRLGLFLNGITSLLSNKTHSSEEIEQRLISLWGKHRPPHLHGYPEESDTPSINDSTQNPNDRPELKDLFDLMELSRVAVIKMLLLEKASYQEYCQIPIPRQKYAEGEKKDAEHAAEVASEMFFNGGIYLNPNSIGVYTDF